MMSVVCCLLVVVVGYCYWLLVAVDCGCGGRCHQGDGGGRGGVVVVVVVLVVVMVGVVGIWLRRCAF